MIRTASRSVKTERFTWEGSQPLGLGSDDARQQVYVIGKTTLLKKPVVLHIARGAGVGLIA